MFLRRLMQSVTTYEQCPQCQLRKTLLIDHYLCQGSWKKAKTNPFLSQPA
jgi:hypothetical protein